MMNRAQELVRAVWIGKIYAALDNDEAGQEATKALAAALGDLLTVLKLPIGNKDVTEFVQAGGDLAEWWAATQRFSWCPDGLWNSIRSALLCRQDRIIGGWKGKNVHLWFARFS